MWYFVVQCFHINFLTPALLMIMFLLFLLHYCSHLLWLMRQLVLHVTSTNQEQNASESWTGLGEAILVRSQFLFQKKEVFPGFYRLTNYCPTFAPLLTFLMSDRSKLFIIWCETWEKLEPCQHLHLDFYEILIFPIEKTIKRQYMATHGFDMVRSVPYQNLMKSIYGP